MKKDVLISIKSKWCEKIISGEKTVEVRKTAPRMKPLFRCFIYCTNGKPTLNIPIFKEMIQEDVTVNGMKSMNCPVGNGKVIGEFTCDRIEKFDSAFSEYAYAVAPPGSVMPMHHTTAFKIMYHDACLSPEDVVKYFGEEDFVAYFWHISNLKIYDEPKTIRDMKFLDTVAFPERRVDFPPQSWRFVQEGI